MLREVKRAALREGWFHIWLPVNVSAIHVFRACLFVEIKSNVNAILVRVVGAEEKAGSARSIDAANATNQPTATKANCLKVFRRSRQSRRKM